MALLRNMLAILIMSIETLQNFSWSSSSKLTFILVVESLFESLRSVIRKSGSTLVSASSEPCDAGTYPRSDKAPKPMNPVAPPLDCSNSAALALLDG